MRGCELAIELDRPDKTYCPGESIRGRIKVTAAEAGRCGQLLLRCEWRTFGKGNRVIGAHTSRDLGSAHWESREQYEYPFDLPAPLGPLSYRGHLLRVDWYLFARADVPWVIDPETQTEFLLRAWNADDLVAGGRGYRDSGPKMIETISSAAAADWEVELPLVVRPPRARAGATPLLRA